MSENRVHKWAVAVCIGLLITLSAQGGSIYKESQRREGSALYTDFKARKVGDVVTILIVESSSASESSSVDTGKKHDFDFALTNVFGLGPKLFGKEEGTELTRGKFGGENAFQGEAKTSNSGAVTAQLTAVVKEVLPTGNLLVEGRRAIYVNKEQRNIILTGTIRPQDISSDNSVRSTYIADASITLEGYGEVIDQARPGFLSRLFNLIPIF